ncbi:MAG: DUF899 domain-containing protein [Pseudomonas sp.]
MNTEQSKVVSRKEWLTARKQLLLREKNFTHERDQLSAERRRLPWVKVYQDYYFDGADLHLAHHDISLVVVSHAPWQEFQAFKQRMGWHFEWVSSDGSEFNHDFGVSASREEIDAGKVTYNYEISKDAGEEMPGLSVFYKNPAGEIFHTYSAFARGLDILLGTYNFLDMTPKGRNEEGTMDWVRHHDRYEGAAVKGSSCCDD